MEVIVGKRGLASGSTHWTLDDYVMDLFENRQTSSEEFKTLERLYGKDKLTKIFEKWLNLGGEK